MAIGGSGTQADPWTIGSADDLVAFAGSTSYWASGTYAVLTADIDMDGRTDFTPIGNLHTPYEGNFDGQKHVISNLTVSASSSSSQGLFGDICEVTIQNIGCEGFDITGYTYVGALVGSCEGFSDSIINCYVKDSVITCTEHAGGLVGYADYGNGISNCYVYDCTISGNNYIGGLIGTAHISISNCAIYGGTHGGTLVGFGSPTVTNCYTSSDVTSTIFHNQDFWNANYGGSLSQTYLSWDFTNIWHWDSMTRIPRLNKSNQNSKVYIKINDVWVKSG